MANKFIRLDDKNRVMDIVEINEPTIPKSKNAFKDLMTKKFSNEDYHEYYDIYPFNTDVEIGQVLKGNKFVDRVDTVAEKAHKERRNAQKEIQRIEKLVVEEILDFVVTLEDCPPALKEFKEELKSNRDKLN